MFVFTLYAASNGSLAYRAAYGVVVVRCFVAWPGILSVVLVAVTDKRYTAFYA